VRNPVSTAESKYIEKKGHLSQHAQEQTLALRASERRLATEFADEEAWFRAAKEDFPKLVPFLIRKCGLDFRGRILEIGAGGA
jgi:hypothetical protein